MTHQQLASQYLFRRGKGLYTEIPCGHLIFKQWTGHCNVDLFPSKSSFFHFRKGPSVCSHVRVLSVQLSADDVSEGCASKVQLAGSWCYPLCNRFALLYPTTCCRQTRGMKRRMQGRKLKWSWESWEYVWWKQSGHFRLAYQTVKRQMFCRHSHANLNKQNKWKIENSITALCFVFQKLKPKQHVKGSAFLEVHL